MMTISVTRRLQYAIGHRVLGHEGKCRLLHGHNFVFLLTAQRGSVFHQQDSIGRVVDFSVLKELIGGWIETFWDHGVVISKDDAEAQMALGMIKEQKMFLLPDNPTAENLGKYILSHVGPKLLEGSGVELVGVRVEETENCSAEVLL